MDFDKWLLPLIFAVSAAPLFVIAGMVSRGHLNLIAGLDARTVRDPAALARRLSRLLAATGFAVLLGGAGMLWAGEDRARQLLVVLAMLVAVNGLGIAIVTTVARARPPSGRPHR